MSITDRDDEFARTIAFLYRQELGRDPDPGGFAVWLEHLRNGMTGPELAKGFHDSPEGIAFRSKPPESVIVAPVVPHLEIRGSDFVDADGQRMVLNGVDAFCAFRQYLDGGAALPALLQESKDLGFNLWRVFLMGSQRQNSILQLSPSEPGYYDELRLFADYVNVNGIILLATVFVDAQDIMPKLGDRQAHWRRVADALRGTGTLVSGGNQFPKNGFAPEELSDPGMLWSRGSSTADPPIFEPKPKGASFCEFHPRRDYPAMMMDTVASAVTIRTRDKVMEPLLITEPIGFAEVERPGSRSADPGIAWRLARHYSTECAGAVFHCDSAMRGQLMGPVQRACAEAWQRGMQL